MLIILLIPTRMIPKKPTTRLQIKLMLKLLIKKTDKDTDTNNPTLVSGDTKDSVITKRPPVTPKQEDSAQQVAANPPKEDSSKKKKKKTGLNLPLYISGGISYQPFSGLDYTESSGGQNQPPQINFDTINPARKSATGWQVQIGLKPIKLGKSSFGLSPHVGLQYLSVSQAEVTRQVQSDTFGSRRFTRITEWKNAFNLRAGIDLVRTTKKGNFQWGAGVQAVYLLSAKGTTREFLRRDSFGLSSFNAFPEARANFTDSLGRFNMTLTLFAQYRIYKRLWLFARGGYDFLDPTKQGFNSPQPTRFSYVLVGLRFNLYE
jgi:hypothetical protein